MLMNDHSPTTDEQASFSANLEVLYLPKHNSSCHYHRQYFTSEGFLFHYVVELTQNTPTYVLRLHSMV